MVEVIWRFVAEAESSVDAAGFRHEATRWDEPDECDAIEISGHCEVGDWIDCHPWGGDGVRTVRQILDGEPRAGDDQ